MTRHKAKFLLAVIVLVAVSFFVYWDVWRYDFINFDDDKYIIDNDHVTTGLTLENAKWAFSFSEDRLKYYWHPLTWMSHMLDVRLFGLDAGMHHLVSLGLHILNVLLLFCVLYGMTGGFLNSLLVAALFAVHPINVDSVAWIAERKNVLSTLFWMLTMLAYLWYVKQPGIRRYLIMLVPFILGLMAKPMLITLPCALLLLDFWPLQRTDLPGLKFQRPAPSDFPKTSLSRIILEKLPLLGLSITGALISIFSVRANQNYVSTDLTPLLLRIQNALVSYVGYIEKIAWPHELTIFYPFPASIPFWQVTAAGLLLAIITAGAVFYVRKAPYLLVGWLWYLGTMFPTIGLFQQGRWPAMADRWAYIPEIGIFIMIIWGSADIFRRYFSRSIIDETVKSPGFVTPAKAGGRKRLRKLDSRLRGNDRYSGFRTFYGFIIFYPVAVSCIVLILMITARVQVSHWKNSMTLFSHAVKVSENNFVANYNLAHALSDNGRVEEAIQYYRQALEIKEDAEAKLNLGAMLVMTGKSDEALKIYSQDLIFTDNVLVYNNIGNALARKGMIDQAMEQFQLALKMKPDSVEALNNMGNILLDQEKTDEAMVYLTRALQADPDSRKVRNNMGNALLKKGMPAEAVAHFAEILKKDPDHVEANINMGVALMRLNRIDEAISHFRTALKSAPENAEAQNNMGALLCRANRYDEARKHFETALRIRPDYASARGNLEKLNTMMENKVQ